MHSNVGKVVRAGIIAQLARFAARLLRQPSPGRPDPMRAFAPSC